MHGALHWLSLGLLLVGTLAAGICVHELLHLFVLHLAGVAYTVTFLPTDDRADVGTAWATLRTALTGSLVRVEVARVPSTAPVWVLRLAAVLPLALALPLLGVAAGVLPDPVATGDPGWTVVLVAGTACGLPSPSDWAVVWYGAEPHAPDGTADENENRQLFPRTS